MNLLSMIRLKVAIFGPWWRDQELDPHVSRAGLRVLNLFQSFFSGDINPLIVAARPSNRWAAPPGPPTCPAPVHCGIKTIYIGWDNLWASIMSIEFEDRYIDWIQCIKSDCYWWLLMQLVRLTNKGKICAHIISWAKKPEYLKSRPAVKNLLNRKWSSLYWWNWTP